MAPVGRTYEAILEKAAGSLLALPGVHMVALGSKTVAGKPTFETAILVYTSRKRALTDISEDQRIPSQIEGVPTDVIETPAIRNFVVPGVEAAQFPDDKNNSLDENRYRPITGGIRIMADSMGGHGTLGFFVRPIGAPTEGVAVTNFHVVTASLIDLPMKRKVGQPDSDSSSWGCCNDIFGKVEAYVSNRTLDYAAIKLGPGTAWKPAVREIGPITGIRPPVTVAEATSQSVRVVKRGQRTGLTGGFVTAVNAVWIIDGIQTSDLVVVQGNPALDPTKPSTFSATGDSGSAILTEDDHLIVALLRGGNNSGFTVGTPIAAVIESMEKPEPDGLGYKVDVAIAESADEVRTVSAAPSAMVMAEPAASPEALRALEAVRATQLGAWYAALYERHRNELVGLINGNRKVATAWHRSGTAEVFQTLRRGPQDPMARVPATVAGRTIGGALDAFAAILRRHASAGLSRDLDRFVRTLPDLAGLTLHDLIRRLALGAPPADVCAGEVA